MRDAGLSTLASEARRFLAAQPWCARVLQVTPVFATGGVVAVFRCTLIPSRADGDGMVWVVVGDLPSAVVAHEPGDSWQDALHGYMERIAPWAEAVRTGAPLDGIAPVDAPATPEYAEALASRLESLRTRLLDVDPDSVQSDV